MNARLRNEVERIDEINKSCLAYMKTFGLYDCEETRKWLAVDLHVSTEIVDTLSRYGWLGPCAEGGYSAQPLARAA